MWEEKQNEVLGNNKKAEETEMEEKQRNDPNYWEKFVQPAFLLKLDQIDMIDTKANRNMSPLHKMRAKLQKKTDEPTGPVTPTSPAESKEEEAAV